MAEATLLQVFRSQADATATDSSTPFSANNAYLCPSMDLIMIKDSYSPKSTTAVKILNTIDRREVATLQLPASPSEGESVQILSFAWSPNGQSVAVITTCRHSTTQQQQQQQVNKINSPNNTTKQQQCQVSLFHILAAQAGGEPLEPYHSFTISGTVQNATWCMVGKDHPSRWSYSCEEEEQEIAWRTQLRYVDRSNLFLPQRGILNPDGMMDSSLAMAGDSSLMLLPPDEDISTLIPKARNALTALCLTKDMGYDLYIHGRSWLGSVRALPPSTRNATVTVSSHDMTYWVSASTLPSSDCHHLSIAHLPWIKDQQSKLKQVSASMAAIQTSLYVLDQSVVADDWKTSLKRLDVLLQMMVEELRKYGVDVHGGKQTSDTHGDDDALELAEIIRVYITTGTSADGKSYDEYSNVANAMDTFFTKGQMHDRLLERLDESLQTALANVESNVQKFLVRPAQALCVQLGELMRLSLWDRQVVHELHNAGGELLGSVTELQKRVVYSRTVVKQFCEWLRSARALVQSKGTTVNPVLKKRRIKPQVLNGVVTALTNRDVNANQKTKKRQRGGLTECLLSLGVTELIIGDGSTSENTDPCAKSILMTSPTHVQPSLEKVKEMFEWFLSRPFLDVPEEITSNDKEFVSTVTIPAIGNSRISFHTRIGSDMDSNDCIIDWLEQQHEVEDTFFSPQIVSWPDGLIRGDKLNCRQWVVAARWNDTTIQLYGMPLGIEEGDGSFVLTSTLEIPEGHKILTLGFYGNDGKSFLSSGSDGGTGNDGPYDVAFLCQSGESTGPILMFVPYQEVRWQAVLRANLSEYEINDECYFKVVQASRENEDDEEAENTIKARVLNLPNSISADEYFIEFSATRGTTMVTSIRADEGSITHTVLDVAKRDEEEEEDQDDDEDMESEN
ncbi:anaphase-promoting complex, cyclosome, subunit 4 [Nitzschia inconspicua]|uniref:Anaphase-promoting complex, cyclosome, subunit 4 n=1 Tax=Nitzschia inconspicua TaxID=303405 RepID=A0A9K3LLU5_9STRA|nr:anaphase-promoting complex, cyclosome, subunit 4 [Nitzschia inconspicua]